MISWGAVVMIRVMTWTVVGLALGPILMASRLIAAGAFDGTYAGRQIETQNNNSGMCQNINKDTRVVVANNVIRYSWGVPLETTVGGDGSFSVDHAGLAVRGAAASVSLKGRITGGNLEADVGGNRCAAHLSLKKM
jgi:hypothetical protein